MEPARFSARFPPHPICVLLGLTLLSTLVDARLGLDTVYDVLKANGLPIGLLPKGVHDFTIDDESGWFRVRLDQACNAKFESEVHYDRNISGVLSYGRISNITGVEAQELFLWFPVKSIHVDIPSSGLIYFDVSVVFKQFSLSLRMTKCEEATCYLRG
uniref:Uncharacterized protein n=1 Tax=Kalanchoe fedtschenkoi TaxID=63787 RepID=A0A7N1A4B5_KALFE